MIYHKLSEEDTKRIEITPAIVARGWDNKLQIRQEMSFTKGRIMVRGREVKRGEPKRADYVLFYKPNLPLAIVEAKSCYKSVGAGTGKFCKYILKDLIDFGPKNGFSPKSVNFKTSTKSLTLTATTYGKFDGRCFKYINEKVDRNSYLWLKKGDILIQRGNSIEYVGVFCIICLILS